VEGGVLYENAALPSASLPSSPASKGAGESRYSGGILLGVRRGRGGTGEETEETGGTVLAVFKTEEKRVFGKEELAVLRRFVEVLREWL
jgi:hypothetical protein